MIVRKVLWLWSWGLGNVTFHGQLSEVPLEVINGREKDFHVKNKLLRHSYRFQVLTAAHMS